MMLRNMKLPTGKAFAWLLNVARKSLSCFAFEQAAVRSRASFPFPNGIETMTKMEEVGRFSGNP